MKYFDGNYSIMDWGVAAVQRLLGLLTEGEIGYCYGVLGVGEKEKTKVFREILQE